MRIFCAKEQKDNRSYTEYAQMLEDMMKIDNAEGLIMEKVISAPDEKALNQVITFSSALEVKKAN